MDLFDPLAKTAAAPVAAPIQAKHMASRLPKKRPLPLRGYFQIADEDGQGVIPVKKAVPFLLNSKLPQNMLSEIAKLIALCQHQKPVSIQFLATSISIGGQQQPLGSASPATPAPAAPISMQHTGSRSIAPISAQSTGSSGTSSSLSLTQAEIDRFSAAFASCNPVDGFVTGDAAKELFLKSDLPLETLGKIWMLVDAAGTMKLNMNQFFAAMYIIFKVKTGVLQTVPAFVPPGLWTAISSATETVSAPPSSASSPTLPLPNSAQGQNTNSPLLQPQQSQPTGMPLLPPPPSSGSPLLTARRTLMMGRGGSTGAPAIGGLNAQALSALASSQEWSVKEEDRTMAFQFFDQLDVNKRGYLSGEDSYGFFLKSNLEQRHPCKDLGPFNITKSGKLSKEEFAVAYYLIKSVLSGQALPDTLPSALIPPRLRPQAPAASPSSSLSSRATVIGAPSLRSPSMGTSFSYEGNDFTASPTSAMPQPSFAPSAPAPVAAPEADPFGLSDAFGDNAKAPIATAIPPPLPPTMLSPKKMPPPVPESRPVGDLSRRMTTLAGGFGSSGNLLSDDRTADLERAKAQVAILEKELSALAPLQESLKTRRANYESESAALAKKKQDLNTRFAQIQAEYDAEVRMFKETEDALKRENVVLQSVMAELTEARRLLGERQDRRREITDAILSCKEMVESIRKELEQVTTTADRYRSEIDRMRPELKTVQAELKRQTNVLNVNRQVLTAAEAEYQQIKVEQQEVVENEKKRLVALAAAAPVSARPLGAASSERALDRNKSASAHSLRSDGGSKRPPAPPPPASRNAAAAAAVVSPTAGVVSTPTPATPTPAPIPEEDPFKLSSPASNTTDPFAVPASPMSSPQQQPISARAATPSAFDAFAGVEFPSSTPQDPTTPSTLTQTPSLSVATQSQAPDPFGFDDAFANIPINPVVVETPATPKTEIAPPPMPPLSTKPSRPLPSASSPHPGSASSTVPPPELPPLSTKPKRPVSVANSDPKPEAVVVSNPEAKVALPTFDDVDFTAAFSAVPPVEPVRTDAFDFDAAFSAPANIPSPTSPSAAAPAPAFDPFAADFGTFGESVATGAEMTFDFDEAFGGSWRRNGEREIQVKESVQATETAAEEGEVKDSAPAAAPAVEEEEMKDGALAAAPVLEEELVKEVAPAAAPVIEEGVDVMEEVKEVVAVEGLTMTIDDALEKQNEEVHDVAEVGEVREVQVEETPADGVEEKRDVAAVDSSTNVETVDDSKNLEEVDVITEAAKE
ncbi:hypothetical protein BC829DRAFT_446976 [Chytridium lagenaria]|nr:hypothetical protein BC829DRAFT_446976 [Chytridium lagenaria]